MTERDERALRALLYQLESDRDFGIEEWVVPRGRTPPLRAASAPVPSRVASAPAEPPPIPTGGVRVGPLRERLGPADARARLEEIDREVRVCILCKLHGTRTHAVPGEGNVGADLMFVGEGPGADEDRSGRPFVGASGEMLTRIIEAMGFSRETVFIANIVKCRPPGNRDPEPDEVSSCAPYLDRQIDVVRPRVLCALGLPATRHLVKVEGGISKVRGKRFEYREIPVIPTFHPAYLLRNPAGKAQVWQDVQLVAALVEEQGGVIPFPERLAAARGGRT